MFWRGLDRQLDAHPEVDALPHLVFNGLILWEPLFVFGWLQLRWERAFGLVPGILLAGLSLGFYHLGTYPLLGIAGLVGIGVFYAALFRITRNLLSLWPLTWAVGSSVGTLQGGFQMGWTQVQIYAVLVAAQIAVVLWVIRDRRPPAR